MGLFADIQAAVKVGMVLPIVSNPVGSLVLDCGPCAGSVGAAETVLVEQPRAVAANVPTYTPQSAEERHMDMLFRGIDPITHPERCPVCWDGERNADPACTWPKQ